jgi:hypothetical protein
MPTQNSTAPMGTSRGDATSLSVRALVGRGAVDSTDDALSWGVGRPLVTDVVPDARDDRGPDVARGPSAYHDSVLPLLLGLAGRTVEA